MELAVHLRRCKKAYGVLEEDDVDVGRKDFVGDRVVHLSFGILRDQLVPQP